MKCVLAKRNAGLTSGGYKVSEREGDNLKGGVNVPGEDMDSYLGGG